MCKRKSLSFGTKHEVKYLSTLEVLSWNVFVWFKLYLEYYSPQNQLSPQWQCQLLIKTPLLNDVTTAHVSTLTKSSRCKRGQSTVSLWTLFKGVLTVPYRLWCMRNLLLKAPVWKSTQTFSASVTRTKENMTVAPPTQSQWGLWRLMEDCKYGFTFLFFSTIHDEKKTQKLHNTPTNNPWRIMRKSTQSFTLDRHNTRDVSYNLPKRSRIF